MRVRVGSSAPMGRFALGPSSLSTVQLLTGGGRPGCAGRTARRALMQSVFRDRIERMLSDDAGRVIRVRSGSGAPNRGRARPHTLVCSPGCRGSFVIIYDVIRASSCPRVLVVAIRPVSPRG